MNKKIFCFFLGVIALCQLNAMRRRSRVVRGDEEDGVALIAQQDAKEAARFANLSFKEKSLFAAVINGYPRVVKMLLKFTNVNVNAIDNFKNTALHYAVYGGEYEIARLLVEVGADLKLTNVYCNTPLMVAQQSCAELYAQGRDVRSFDKIISILQLNVRLEKLLAIG